ncbi:MAG: thermonuclease family protein [Phycisphaeraceae bacterium]
MVRSRLKAGGRRHGGTGAGRALSLRRFVRTRRRRRQAIAAAVVLLLGVLVLVDRAGLGLYQGDDVARYDGQRFRVAYVVDGDTLDVAAPDGDRATTRVRLWGIDTPESAWPERGRPEPEPFASESSDFARDLVDGQWVTLELESHRVRGGYGRLLAYVTLDDDTSLNERMLEAGLAEADDRWSHRHVEHYDRLEREARAAGRGMWAQP